MSSLNSRDEEMAEEVAIMAELGKFEVEFTMYGCAYYENGKVKYLVSENAEKIYDFMYDIVNAEKLPTNIHSATMRTLVPSGAEAYILSEVRKQLLDKLYQLYDEKYFEILFEMQNVLRKDTAYSALKDLQYRFDGTCNQEQLQIFQGILESAYRKKILSTESYMEFQQWIRWTKRDLDQEPIKSDLYEKTFYALAYFKERQPIQIYVDGYKNNIYKRIEQRRAEGYIVSNIVTKKYWYNNQYTVVQAKKDYETFLNSLFGEWYIDSMQKISTLHGPIKQTEGENFELYSISLQNEDVKHSFSRQCGLWRVDTF